MNFSMYYLIATLPQLQFPVPVTDWVTPKPVTLPTTDWVTMKAIFPTIDWVTMKVIFPTTVIVPPEPVAIVGRPWHFDPEMEAKIASDALLTQVSQVGTVQNHFKQ